MGRLRILHIVFRPSHLAVSLSVSSIIKGKHVFVISDEFEYKEYLQTYRDLLDNIYTFKVLSKPDFSLKIFFFELKKIAHIRKEISRLIGFINSFSPHYVVIYSDEHILSRIVLKHTESTILLIEDGLILYRKYPLLKGMKRWLHENTRNTVWQLITLVSTEFWWGYGRNKKIKILVRSFRSERGTLKIPNVIELEYPVFLAAASYLSKLMIKNSNDGVSESKQCSERVIYFIGQPFYQHSIVDEKSYLDALNGIAEKLKNIVDELVYIPHPTEKIVDKTVNNTGFTVVKPARTAEQFILERETKFPVVIGINSTVLYNVSFLGIPTASISTWFNPNLVAEIEQRVLSRICFPSNIDDLEDWYCNALEREPKFKEKISLISGNFVERIREIFGQYSAQ